VGKPEGRTPLRISRPRLEDNIKIDLKKIGWGDVDWIDLAQDRNQWRALMKALMYFRVLLNIRILLGR
jgi:hypothetical protein